MLRWTGIAKRRVSATKLYLKFSKLTAPTDDDHIETAVFVRMKEATGVPTATAADVTMHDDDADAPAGAQTGPHGTNADGKAASCALSTSGPVDCAACLESALVDLRASLEPDDAVVLDSLVQQLDDAGPPGLTRKQLVCATITHNCLASRPVSSAGDNLFAGPGQAIGADWPAHRRLPTYRVLDRVQRGRVGIFAIRRRVVSRLGAG